MPLDSLAKLMGHSDLHTTQGYIDGADPVVRADFLAAISQLDELALPRDSGLPQFPAVVAEQRPDHAAILEKLSQWEADLPPWLWSHLYQHTLRQMPHWTSAHLEKRARFHLGTLCRMCRWLVKERDWTALDQLRRADVIAYLNHRQEEGLKASSIATELGLFRGFWRDLVEQEVVLNGAILQVKSPPQAEPLPKYLTSDEFQKLEQVIRTETAPQRHRDWFNRAWFYLLAHGGLRISEALNLRLSDCDFSHRRLRIRAGKGNRDRVIPMTPKLVTVIQEYLAVRESAKTDHLLLFQSRPVDVKLVYRRLKIFGQQAGIEGLSPHRLRHTLATLLINGGMPITSLQKFLGHQDVNQTLIYGRVHDETVRRQFATAMAQIETILVSHWPTPEEAAVENSPLGMASSSG